MSGFQTRQIVELSRQVHEYKAEIERLNESLRMIYDLMLIDCAGIAMPILEMEIKRHDKSQRN